jgi:hypothetical protein
MRRGLDITLELIKSPEFAEHGIGWIRREKMCRSVDLMNQNIKLTRPVSCDEVYNGELVPLVRLP